jgi:ribosomal protein S20
MQISSIGNSSFPPAGAVESIANIKQSIQKLGSALESGNLSDAKDALAQLKKNAPAQAGKDNDPIRSKIETLSKAVDSGDLKAAQQAYADVKKTISQQRPAAGGPQARGPGGAPPRGAPPGGAKKSSSAAGSSSSNKVYDKRDSNKDGTVSELEKLDYRLKHPEEASNSSATAKSDSKSGTINVVA